MAGTYGLLTGRPGLAIATRGPGAAYGGQWRRTGHARPLPVARRHRLRVQRRPRSLCTPAHRSAADARSGDQVEWSAGLVATRQPRRLRAALELAGTRPAGAVHLDYDPRGSEMVAPPPSTTARSPDDVVARAAAMVSGAAKPVAIVGLEALSSAGDVLGVLERLGCPVLTTYQGIGVVPDGHPQLAGLYTSGAIEASILDSATSCWQSVSIRSSRCRLRGGTTCPSSRCRKSPPARRWCRSPSRCSDRCRSCSSGSLLTATCRWPHRLRSGRSRHGARCACCQQ